MARTAVASDDGHPWRLVGVGLAGFTIYKAARGRKVDTLVLVGALVTVASFVADQWI
jgi:hypothetical protein